MKVKDGIIILEDGAAVRYVPTKKQGGVLKPVGIVMHYTAGYTTAGDVDTLAKSDRKASAHLVVGRDGELVQIVPFDRVAWHAGPSKYKDMSSLNNYAIGIEISNCGWLRKTPTGKYQDEYGNTMTPDGEFVTGHRRLHSSPDGWLHQKHPRLGSAEVAWEPYYPAQLTTLDAVVKALCGAYDIKWIVSHEEIDTRGWKTDPGPAFPMQRYQTILKDHYYFPDLPLVPSKPLVFDDTEQVVKPVVAVPVTRDADGKATTPTIILEGGGGGGGGEPSEPPAKKVSPVQAWWQRWFGR